MTRGQLTTSDDIKHYCTAGNATITLAGKRSRFTYKIRKATGNNSIWFVGVLSGNDNEHDFTFLGTIFGDGNYRHGRKSSISPAAPSARAWSWFYQLVFEDNRTHPDLTVWHEGSCGRCGRKLTVPESVARGIGPECATMMDNYLEE